MASRARAREQHRMRCRTALRGGLLLLCDEPKREMVRGVPQVDRVDEHLAVAGRWEGNGHGATQGGGDVDRLAVRDRPIGALLAASPSQAPASPIPRKLPPPTHDLDRSPQRGARRRERCGRADGVDQEEDGVTRGGVRRLDPVRPDVTRFGPVDSDVTPVKRMWPDYELQADSRRLSCTSSAEGVGRRSAISQRKCGAQAVRRVLRL